PGNVPPTPSAGRHRVPPPPVDEDDVAQGHVAGGVRQPEQLEEATVVSRRDDSLPGAAHQQHDGVGPARRGVAERAVGPGDEVVEGDGGAEPGRPPQEAAPLEEGVDLGEPAELGNRVGPGDRIAGAGEDHRLRGIEAQGRTGLQAHDEPPTLGDSERGKCSPPTLRRACDRNEPPRPADGGGGGGVLADRWRRLHESLTIAPDHRGVNNTTDPRPDRPRAGRLALASVAAASAAVLLLAGCGGGADPTPRPAASAAGTAAASLPATGATSLPATGATSPPATGATSAAAGTGAASPPATGTSGPSIGETAASAGTNPAVPAADTDQDLADVDRALSDLDTQITGVDRDVATPEGDLR